MVAPNGGSARRYQELFALFAVPTAAGLAAGCGMAFAFGRRVAACRDRVWGQGVVVMGAMRGAARRR
jgi:hypothetical protein